MSDFKLVYEQFKSYDHLLNTLKSRKNNRYMTSKSSEKQGDEEWYGTKSYDEAVKMIGTGYLKIVDKLKKNVENQAKINAKYLSTVNHARPHNAVVGYIPNVPAALLNLPQSMISIDKKPMKRKTLHILYIICGSASQSTEYFTQAGTALLSAVDVVEKSGIQTKIDLAFYAGREDDEICMPSICIKNYGERFSIQKVSFPLAHPSMFRRIGFKWLETTPEMTKDFSCGYGVPLSYQECEEVGDRIKEPNTYTMSVPWIHANDCSVEAILKKLEVI